MTKYTILVADNDPLVLGVHKRMIGRAGYTVLSASDRKEAEGLLGSHPEIAAAVLDMDMGAGNDGLELTRLISGRIPVFIVSGDLEHHRGMIEGYKCRGWLTGTLQKPTDRDELVDALRSVVGVN